MRRVQDFDQCMEENQDSEVSIDAWRRIGGRERCVEENGIDKSGLDGAKEKIYKFG